MSALSEPDFRAALGFVGDMHDAQDREEFRSILLAGYRSLVPALHVSYNENGRQAHAACSREAGSRRPRPGCLDRLGGGLLAEL